MGKRTFYEFFAGGGMARSGLGEGWRCLFANDFDEKKAEAYRANWGASEFCLGDIHKLSAKELPGSADLAWASFPCQDLSLAGNGAGLSGERSGAFWGFWSLVDGLKKQKRPPKLLVIENVIGALTSNGGADFVELCRALSSCGYLVGALTIDAVHFLPQSRPRLFIVCALDSLPGIATIAQDKPSSPWHSAALMRAVSLLPKAVRSNWRWWSLPLPVARNIRLADLIEENPSDVNWHTRAETARLISLMSEVNLEKLESAKRSGQREVGTIYRRTRIDENGRKAQRAEVRFDGVAGCLRTPGGGSSRQFIIVVDGERVRTRLLSAREAARLMGLPDEYLLPARYNDAYHLLGDGLAAPAVRFLANEILSNLLKRSPVARFAAE